MILRILVLDSVLASHRRYGKMATQYYIQRDDHETGPFRFAELIAFVREGKLVHADRVRYSWTTEWQRADSLVGLFHMAQRPPKILTPPADLCPPLRSNAIPPDQDVPAAIAKAFERPGWVMRLMQVSGIRGKNRAEISIHGPAPATPTEASQFVAPQVDSDEPASSPETPRIPNEEQPAEIAAFFSQGVTSERNHWSSTVDEAMAAVKARGTAKSKTPRSGRFGKMLGVLARIIPRDQEDHSLVRNGFRIVSAIISAGLAAWVVASWSAEESLRFPSRDTQQSALQHFPLFGTCDSSEYLFLMFDLMLLTGAAAWFAAGWLESHAD